MKLINIATIALLALPLTLGCAVNTADGSADMGVAQSADELGTKFHYDASISNVSFDGGCVPSNQPQDCAYGFELRYTKQYVDLQTTIKHTTNNVTRTITITVDTWSRSKIHSMMMVGPQDDDLGLLEAKVGQPYAVKVVDRNGKSLWSGNVNTLFHL